MRKLMDTSTSSPVGTKPAAPTSWPKWPRPSPAWPGRGLSIGIWSRTDRRAPRRFTDRAKREIQGSTVSFLRTVSLVTIVLTRAMIAVAR